MSGFLRIFVLDMGKHSKEKSPELREKIAILPDTPGVYMYYDAEGTVIYVGKAKNLKRRVSSYFNRTHDVLRTNLLVRAIADMSYIVVPTEQDALNLENSMIKEYKPRYNVLLKDDKSYPWICVTKELYPRVFLTRQRTRDGSKYFGPYTDTASARAVLDLIRELYPVRMCRVPITPDTLARGKGRLCLEYHLKRCLGCCKEMVSAEEYGGYIERIRQILRGETGELMTYLRGEMERLASELRFEEAQELKQKYLLVERYNAKSAIVSQTLDQIDVFGVDDDGSNDVYINYMHVRRGAVARSLTLQYKRRLEEGVPQLLGYAMDEVRSRFSLTYDEVVVPQEPDADFPGVTFTVPQRGDKAKLLDVSARNARQSRVDALKHLEKLDPEKRAERTLERMKADFRLSELPRHVECFDNSNIQGTNPVASCVVFRNAKPSKKDYRHFCIKTVVGPDDFASMKEVLTRRYTRMLAETPDDLPQLVVVDGAALSRRGGFRRDRHPRKSGARRDRQTPGGDIFPRRLRAALYRQEFRIAARGAAPARRGTPLRHHPPPRPTLQRADRKRALADKRDRPRHRTGTAEAVPLRETHRGSHHRRPGRGHRPRQGAPGPRPLHRKNK